MDKDTHKAWAGNWYRGGANWLENRLNNTLNKDEEHDDRAMMRDAITKLNQAADEIDRLYQIEKERDFLISEYERAVKCGPQGFAYAAGHIYNAIVNAQCDVNTEHFIEMRNQRDAALEREQALAKEASYHQQELDGLLGRLRGTQGERDAHMAHSARVNDILFKTFSAIDDGDNSALPYDEYRDAFNEAPASTLKNYTLMKQAEAIGTVALKRPPGSVQRAWLLEQAEKWLCK